MRTTVFTDWIAMIDTLRANGVQLVVDIRDTKLASDKVHPQDSTAMYSAFQNSSGLA